jgi:carbon storage regulator
MLVLRRKVGATIVIGDSIIVKVMGIEGEQVKLGIEAPRNVTIHREEVYEAIREENRLAGQHAPGLKLEQIRGLSIRKE